MPVSHKGRRIGLPGVLTRLVGIVAISVAMGVLVAGFAIPFAAVTGVAARSVADGIDNLPASLTTEPLAQRTRVLDRNDRPIATLFDEYRVNVGLEEVAPIMRKAILAIEDYRFYEHGALDLKGTLRAFVTNQTSDEVVQGGSTITQQMVKLTLVSQAETEEEIAAATAGTYKRKIEELRYAIAFEEKYDKDWILERYLNIAYFGAGAYGIEAASRRYFSKSASDLELHEAALLAGLVKNPTGYSPTNNRPAARERRDVVVNRMAELNVISREEADEVISRGLGLDLRPIPNGCVSSPAPFFCEYVREYLLRDEALGETREARLEAITGGGLTIKTTVDLRMQRAADRSVRKHVNATDRAVGALAMVEPGTGKVRAVAQSRPMGRNVKEGQTFLNYVVPKRYGNANGFQAGSTFKVFVLAAAIEQGIPLNTRIQAPPQVSLPINRFRGCDGPLRSSDTWEPQNSTGSGRFDLYSGTQQSVNTFFAKLEMRTGLCRPFRLAKQMGITLDDPDNQQVPAFTLGVVDTDPLSMAEAYATFAARGVHCESRPVEEVVLPNGETKKYPKKCGRVLERPVADAVNDVLRGVQEPGGFGHNAGISLRQPSAGKTGTINRNMAVWFVGYTPNMATASMIAGADRQGRWKTLNGQVVGGSRIVRAAGSTNAGPMWGDAMKVVQRWLPDRDFKKPNPRKVEGRTVRVPNVVGDNRRVASRKLRQRGLVPQVGPMVDSGRPRGTVAYVRPEVGAEVGSGRTVTLFISDGTPYVPPAPQPAQPAPDSSAGSGGGGGGQGPGRGQGQGRGQGRGPG